MTASYGSTRIILGDRLGHTIQLCMQHVVLVIIGYVVAGKYPSLL